MIIVVGLCGYCGGRTFRNLSQKMGLPNTTIMCIFRFCLKDWGVLQTVILQLPSVRIAGYRNMFLRSGAKFEFYLSN